MNEWRYRRRLNALTVSKSVLGADGQSPDLDFRADPYIKGGLVNSRNPR